MFKLTKLIMIIITKIENGDHISKVIKKSNCSYNYGYNNIRKLEDNNFIFIEKNIKKRITCITLTEKGEDLKIKCLNLMSIINKR